MFAGLLPTPGSLNGLVLCYFLVSNLSGRSLILEVDPFHVFILISCFYTLWFSDVCGGHGKKSVERNHCVKSVQIRSFFWSVFSCIRTEYGDLLRKSPYSVQIQENTDQKKLRIQAFSRSDGLSFSYFFLFPLETCFFFVRYYFTEMLHLSKVSSIEGSFTNRKTCHFQPKKSFVQNKSIEFSVYLKICQVK